MNVSSSVLLIILPLEDITAVTIMVVLTTTISIVTIPPEIIVGVTAEMNVVIITVLDEICALTAGMIVIITTSTGIGTAVMAVEITETITTAMEASDAVSSLRTTMETTGMLPQCRAVMKRNMVRLSIRAAMITEDFHSRRITITAICRQSLFLQAIRRIPLLPQDQAIMRYRFPA